MNNPCLLVWPLLFNTVLLGTLCITCRRYMQTWRWHYTSTPQVSGEDEGNFIWNENYFQVSVTDSTHVRGASGHVWLLKSRMCYPWLRTDSGRGCGEQKTRCGSLCAVRSLSMFVEWIPSTFLDGIN